MGQRSSTETLIAVFVAFLARPTWSQAELSREAGVEPRTLRRVLTELCDAGWPLEREEDHPHVYWSLPRGFLPGGILLKPSSLSDLLRVVARSPATAERTALLRQVSASLPRAAGELLERLVPGRVSEVEARALVVLEDAVESRRPVDVRYYSSNSGRISERAVSVQRIMLGPPARCVGFCHRAQALRWFRVDSMVSLSLAPTEVFVESSPAEVDELVARSVDGFAQGKPQRIAFVVRDPDARWVRGNLPDGLVAHDMDGGIRVETETAGLLPIARFVVGLGDAVHVETAALAAAVRELASAALRAAERTQDGKVAQ